MNSIQTTATTSLGMAGGAQTLIWLSNGHPAPMPEGVALFLLALAAPVIHAAGAWIIAKLNPQTPPAPPPAAH